MTFLSRNAPLLCAVLLLGCGGLSSDALFNGARGTGAADASSSAPGGSEAGLAFGTGATTSGGASTTTNGGAPGTAAGGAPIDGSLGAGGTLPNSGGSGSVTDAARTGAGGAPITVATPGTVFCLGSPNNQCTLTQFPLQTKCCYGGLVACLPDICASGGQSLLCDDAADCPPGNACCGNLSKGSSCQTSCNGNDQLCRTNAECSSQRCEPLGKDSNYSACK